jgi:hypothetical protein
MGWSHRGNTRLKYQHYHNDDAFDAMLTVMDGLVVPGSTNKDKMKNLLKPKHCPNCDEVNKPESEFCVKCKFILSFDAFNEIEEEKSKAAREVEQNRQELQKMKAKGEEQERDTYCSILEHIHPFSFPYFLQFVLLHVSSINISHNL